MLRFPLQRAGEGGPKGRERAARFLTLSPNPSPASGRGEKNKS